MPLERLDPLKRARKNGHIWRGDNAIIWYNEKLDGSFTVLTLYDFGDRKRRLYLEVDNENSKVEFKNDELSPALYERLLDEVKAIEGLLKETR